MFLRTTALGGMSVAGFGTARQVNAGTPRLLVRLVSDHVHAGQVLSDDRLEKFRLKKAGLLISSDGELKALIAAKGIQKLTFQRIEKFGFVYKELPGVVVSITRPATPVNRTTRSPLERAIRAKSVRKIKQIIADGADVNAVGDNKRTPLFAAVKTGSPRIVGLLLSLGADPGKYEASSWNYNFTAYHYALQLKFFDITKLFVEKWGVPADQSVAYNDYGWPPDAIEFAMVWDDKWSEQRPFKFSEAEKILMLLLKTHGGRFLRCANGLHAQAVKVGMNEVAALISKT